MFSCVTFSFSALPCERAVRLIALREFERVDKARGEPLYRLPGGRVRESLPVYATGNEVAWYRSLGSSRFKLAIPYGPAGGWENCKANLALVERAREEAGPDANIMLDCYMAGTWSTRCAWPSWCARAVCAGSRSASRPTTTTAMSS